ncbi:MAG TPA: serine hydrolase domain-containing protein, partial [Polyangiaceae bacterium]|nr:serine hydrolase domain-containing protein [Polyangiaceae bacterium]
LTHTSGLPDTNLEQISCPVGFGQSAAWFNTHGPVPLWTSPGSVWNYNNTGYSLMGWVIESVTGEAYEDAAANLILGPAGMSTATFDPALAMAADHAVGHEGSTFLEPNAFDCAVERPPAGVIASVADYAKFAEMLMSSGGSVLEPSSVTAMETPWAQTDNYPDNTEQYGYGLYLHEGYVYRVWHEGNIDGFQSSIYMVPAQNWAVVVFFNSSSGNPNVVSQFAVDTFLLPPSAKAPVVTTPPSSWTGYQGTYVDPYGIYQSPDAGLGTINVSLQGSELVADWNGQTSPDGSATPIVSFTSTQLTQVASDRFKGIFGGAGTQDVTFFPGEDGGAAAWFVTRVGVGARQ